MNDGRGRPALGIWRYGRKKCKGVSEKSFRVRERVKIKMEIEGEIRKERKKDCFGSRKAVNVKLEEGGRLGRSRA